MSTSTEIDRGIVENHQADLRSVLVGVDGSDGSRRALEWAARFASQTGADVLAVLTEWDDFRWIDPDRVAELMAEAHVVDARNILERAAWQRAGFTYQGVGR